MALPRMLVTALVATALAAPTAAHAGDDSRFYGSCSFASVPESVGADSFRGEVDAQVLVYSATHGNVVAATVTCEIRVNGVTQATVSGSGSGVVAFAGPVAYTATAEDYVRLCTVVDYTSDWTPTAEHCPGATTLEAPPKWMSEALDYTLRTVDPLACEALRLAAPGAGPVAVTAEGDVYLHGELFYDCPPYEWPTDPEPPVPLPDPSTLGGAGHNDGSTGFLTLFTPGSLSLVSTCAFSTVGGVATVTGRTVAPGADASSVGCRLEDAATGTVLYDETVTAAGGSAAVRDTVAVSGAVTVCTQGSATFGTRTDTVGRHCRPGLPV